MKKLIAIIGLTLMTSAASASVLKVCAVQANETCAEITNREDFLQCHNAIMQMCLDYGNGNYKSVPACERYCNSLPEPTQRQICLQTCEPKF
ncbi:hypothetical protein BIY24_10945 [Halobacteriovorax marinus]|nr:hypothetical protein [Halobacteriovorax marinus]ATH08446.1 hypothetical protein BIY24_10945 [Halobacteriovorax marinus]